MMILSKLNGIAARIATAIVLAIIVGLVMAFGLSIGLSWYGFRHDHAPDDSRRVILVSFIAHRNLVMLSGEIATTIRAAAALPRPERQKIIAAIADPDIAIALDAPAGPEAGAGVDYSVDRLRSLVQMQLSELSSPIMVSARRPPVGSDRSGDRDRSSSASERQAVLEAALPDG